MGLTHLVVATGVVKDTLGRCSLACINVRTDTNVSVTFDRSLSCHCINLGLLETEMREGLVGFCHTMDVFTLLNCRTLAFYSIKDFTSKALRHAFLTALPGIFNEPAHRQRVLTGRPNFNRHLVSSTTHTTGLNLNHRLDVLQGLLEHFDRLFFRFLGNNIQSTVNNALCNRLLTAFHHMVDELGKTCTAEFRIGNDFPLCCNSSSRHR